MTRVIQPHKVGAVFEMRTEHTESFFLYIWFLFNFLNSNMPCFKEQFNFSCGKSSYFLSCHELDEKYYITVMSVTYRGIVFKEFTLVKVSKNVKKIYLKY